MNGEPLAATLRRLLVDIGLPGLNGIQSVRLLRLRYPGIAAGMLQFSKTTIGSLKPSARALAATC